MMLDSRVTILNSRMVNLDRDSKKIGLATGASISYDILVIAVGLID
jgi:NADH dehydrogenase FAD-containing subunit